MPLPLNRIEKLGVPEDNGRSPGRRKWVSRSWHPEVGKWVSRSCAEVAKLPTDDLRHICYVDIMDSLIFRL